MTLKDSANRWVNLLIAALNVVFFILQWIGHASERRQGAVLADVVLALIICVLIVWHAWKPPKQEI